MCEGADGGRTQQTRGLAVGQEPGSRRVQNTRQEESQQARRDSEPSLRHHLSSDGNILGTEGGIGSTRRCERGPTRAYRMRGATGPPLHDEQTDVAPTCRSASWSTQHGRAARDHAITLLFCSAAPARADRRCAVRRRRDPWGVPWLARRCRWAVHRWTKADQPASAALLSARRAEALAHPVAATARSVPEVVFA